LNVSSCMIVIACLSRLPIRRTPREYARPRVGQTVPAQYWGSLAILFHFSVSTPSLTVGLLPVLPSSPRAQ